MALRAVAVTAPSVGSYAKGSDAPPQLVIVNTSRTDDRLVNVTTPVAAEVRLFPDAASAAAGGSTAASAGAQQSLNLPRGLATSIGFADTEPLIQLHNLTQQLFPAQSFPITFQFATAGSVTFTIAVHLAPGPPSTPTVNVSPTAES